MENRKGVKFFQINLHMFVTNYQVHSMHTSRYIIDIDYCFASIDRVFFKKSISCAGQQPHVELEDHY